MRQVTLTRDLRPYRAGDHPILEDAVAALLVQNGEAKDSRPWPVVSAQSAPAETVRPPVGHYLTRGKRR